MASEVKTEIASKTSASPMEVIAILGLTCENAYNLVAFFALFFDAPSGINTHERLIIQTVLFASIALGYLVIRFLLAKTSFKIKTKKTIVLAAIVSMFYPLAMLLYYVLGLQIFPVLLACAVAGGLAFSDIRISWLDIVSKIRRHNYSKCIIAGILGGVAICIFTFFCPYGIRLFLALFFLLLSAVLQIYAISRIDYNDDECSSQLDSSNTWAHHMEVGPSFFIFEFAFAMSFDCIIKFSASNPCVWAIALVVGALATYVGYLCRDHINITLVQRIAMVFIVATFVVLLFFNTTEVGLVCSAVLVAVWVFFTSHNAIGLLTNAASININRIACMLAPKLFTVSSGFALGWIVVCFIDIVFDGSSTSYIFLRVIVVIAATTVFMLFFPVKEHHVEARVEGSSESKELRQSQFKEDVHNISATQANLAFKGEQESGEGDFAEGDAAHVETLDEYEAKCRAVAQIYQLSKREAEVLSYLAKGRNLNWIQNKLMISPHTVKSHIYSIYRKTDIHSQQKLMDFVEEFPI
jgi:DNA-binding CsgD family transcriptional regulator